MVAYCTGSDPIEIGDIWLKVKIKVTQYPIFLHISWLNSLLWISLFFYPMKVKFGMLFKYAIGRFTFHFISKFEWKMTSLWCHLSFLQTIVHISISVEPTKNIRGTNIQQHNVHLIECKCDLEIRWRPQVKVRRSQNEQMVISL